MASPMDIIRGSLLSQAQAPASLNQAFRPSIGPSTARRGRPAVDTQPAAATQPDVPNLFGRPTPTQVTQAPDPPTPGVLAPAPAPAPVGPDPSVINQALMLQNLLSGLEQTGMGPLFGAFGVTGGVSANPEPWWSPTGSGGGAAAPWGGGLPHNAGALGQGPGGLGGTGVGWNPWLFGAPNAGWQQHQAAQQAWGTPFNEATQTVLNALSPELQALPAIQTLFGAPLYAQPVQQGAHWIMEAPSWFAGDPAHFNTSPGNPLYSASPFTGVNDPIVNAAIQALMEYIQGGGAPTPTTPPAGGTTPSAT